MKKNLLIATASVAMTIAMASASFAAGWVYDDQGARWQNDDGSFLTDSVTPDGYWVGSDGYWDGGEAEQAASEASEPAETSEPAESSEMSEASDMEEGEYETTYEEFGLTAPTRSSSSAGSSEPAASSSGEEWVVVTVALPSAEGEWATEDGYWIFNKTDGTRSASGWEIIGGNYYYFDTKGHLLVNTNTYDGYRVDENGRWIQNVAKGDEFGSELVSGVSAEGLIGDIIYKSEGNPQVDPNDNYYHLTISVFDTGFFTEDQINTIKKGDTVVLPGLGITTTALTRASASKIVRTSDKSDYYNTAKSSGKKIRLQDAEGNTYVVTSKQVRKESPDGKTETLLRPVAAGIPATVSPRQLVNKASGTVHMSGIQQIMTGGLYFTAEFKNGNHMVSVADSTFNYDTSISNAIDQEELPYSMWDIIQPK